MTEILLVEDDKGIVANLTEYLTSEGYSIGTGRGNEAARE